MPAALFDCVEPERPEASDSTSLADGTGTDPECSGTGFDLVYHLPSSSGRIHTLKISVDLLKHWGQISSSAKTC